ncbi:50S ribosomal protein L24 [Sandaracinomonas limnophila]|uniref:Large ribosomal subunit protein uL24 n=1 Tax=Sandaracinomonas limnophila TaxID=1862386 RepID=A0A437PUC0_9BACT|nr:50S ribosomal protein L24 [Sandaracinomonas limnophila]RVU25861.1 50S ribosomal protein L24 [Sandaracinomonas limnophila]
MENKNNKQSKLHVRTGDTVMVISGNAKGKSGVIKEVIIEKSRAIVEGVNLQTKHVKPSANNPQGGIEKREGSIHISNLMVVENGKAVRTGRKLNDKGKLQRYSKATGKFIG